MRRVIMIAAMLFVLVLTLSAQFQILTNDGHAVQDHVGVLSPGERNQIEDQLRAYEQTTTRAIVVLIVPTLNGVSVEEYANKTFHAWGIGQANKDNGVLFLWSTGDRKVRLEVGYGLESLLPDGRAGQILRDNILPNFKAGHNFAGVQGGVTQVIAQLDRQPEPIAAATTSPAADGTGYLIAFGILGAVVLFGVIVFFATREDEVRQPYVPTYEPSPYVPRPTPSEPVDVLPIAVAAAVVRRRQDDDDDTRPYQAPAYEPPSYHDDSPSFGGFGGGDSGGGGASGSY
jgi:uncharacterized protein